MKYLFMCYTTRYKYFRSNKIYETTVASQCASAHYAVINSTLNFLSKNIYSTKWFDFHQKILNPIL